VCPRLSDCLAPRIPPHLRRDNARLSRRPGNLHGRPGPRQRPSRQARRPDREPVEALRPARARDQPRRGAQPVSRAVHPCDLHRPRRPGIARRHRRHDRPPFAFDARPRRAHVPHGRHAPSRRPRGHVARRQEPQQHRLALRPQHNGRRRWRFDQHVFPPRNARQSRSPLDRRCTQLRQRLLRLVALKELAAVGSLVADNRSAKHRNIQARLAAQERAVRARRPAQGTRGQPHRFAPARLCRRLRRRLRLLPDGARLVPHARRAPRRHHLHLRPDPRRRPGRHRHRRRALPAALQKPLAISLSPAAGKPSPSLSPSPSAIASPSSRSSCKICAPSALLARSPVGP
jgi:hypothetical protein